MLRNNQRSNTRMLPGAEGQGLQNKEVHCLFYTINEQDLTTEFHCDILE